MKRTAQNDVVCYLKETRIQKGFTQTQLADAVGIKRQAVYDIESGRYLPNTGVALKLSRVLGCQVEDLFRETRSGEYKSATLVSNMSVPEGTRVNLAKINDRLIAYPLENDIQPPNGIHPADALLGTSGKEVKLLHDADFLDNSVVLMGCDPAFAILQGHLSRTPDPARLYWRFASSFWSLECLGAGHTHLAGVHLHNEDGDASNLGLARKMLGGQKGLLVAFAMFEEGLMVAPGNPKGIKGMDDLAGGGVKLVNREPGAALRRLLDDYLERESIPSTVVSGYDDLVRSHAEGAFQVQFGMADAALGLRAVAKSFGLDFVPVTTVRSDLVIPESALKLPSVRIMLDILQGNGFREEMDRIPGYATGCMGSTVAKI